MLYCKSRERNLSTEPRKPNLMRLSQKFKKDLESVNLSLLNCREILDKKSKEQEELEWLENWSRWVD